MGSRRSGVVVSSPRWQPLFEVESFAAALATLREQWPEAVARSREGEPPEESSHEEFTIWRDESAAAAGDPRGIVGRMQRSEARIAGGL